MKVLLVHAYFLKRDEAERQVMKPYPPLGLLYLSAWLKKNNYEVEIFDGTFLTVADFHVTLRRFEPGVVGFYANMMTRHNVLELRAQIEDPDIRVVVGGPDPPHYREAYLDHHFHAVIEGEGEAPLLAWLEDLETPEVWPRIPGLSWRQGGETRSNPAPKPKTSLDDLPLPDRGAIDLEGYMTCWEKFHGTRPISLITSRGCPFQCTWCSHNVYGHSLRKRSPEGVAEEMEWLNQHYQFNRYWFADDVFTILPRWIFQLRDLLRERAALIKPFECISRADKLDAEVIDALQELRCARLWVGAESGSQRLLDLMKRGVRRDQVIEAMSLLRGAGIETGMFFMWGFMDERYEDVVETVDLAVQCMPDIALTTIAYPIKGTAFHSILAEAGQLAENLDFASGTDRDLRIKDQADPATYRLANQLLHSSMQSKRLRKGNMEQRLKAGAHQLRAHYLRGRLKRAFAGKPA